MTDIYELVEDQGLLYGRIISGSKTTPPGCRCIWNANLVSPSRGKFWYGDINLTTEGNKLKAAAEKAGEPIYVLRESDCRFRTEADSIEMLLKRAVWNTTMDVI